MLKLFRQYYPVRNIFFVLGEGFAIYASVLLSTWILLDTQVNTLSQLYSSKALLIAVVCHLFLYYNDLYDLNVTNSFSELTIRLFQSLGAAAILLAGIYFLFPETMITRWVFAVSTVLTITLIIVWRYGYLLILNKGWFDENIIVIGSGGLSQSILSELHNRKDSGYRVKCVALENEKSSEMMNSKGFRTIYRPNFDGIHRIALHTGVNKIIVALADRKGSFPAKELLKCRVTGMRIVEGISFFEMLTGKLIVHQVNPTWLIFSEGFRKSFLLRSLKRLADLLLSLGMLICLFPLLLLVAILIKLDSKGNVFFSQERVGEQRNPYNVVKFRSMVADAEKSTGPVWAGDEDPRITRVGRVIRKLRIDEVPQLWNVLKGEMSFVGPRPERQFFVEQLEEIIPYYSERFSVKPGITGWAQVSYGYGASIEDAIEKLNYDLFYIKNMSIFMDMMIVLKTVKIVLFGKGAR